MPPVTNLDETKIMRGFPVHIYLDLTFDSKGRVFNLQTDGTVLVADHPNGVELGFTQGGAELVRSQTRGGLDVDQRLTMIRRSLTGGEAHLRTGFLQTVDKELLAMLTPGASYDSDGYAEGVSDQIDQSFDLHSVTAIAPVEADPTKFHQLTVYAASNMADMLLRLSKEDHKMPLDFIAEDAGRLDGKTWYAGIITPD